MTDICKILKLLTIKMGLAPWKINLTAKRRDLLWQRGRKRYIKPAAAISSRIVFALFPTQRETSISSEARSWRVSRFDGLRFLRTLLFCSYRRLPVLRSALFRQQIQNGFLLIHRRRWHTDVLLCTRMQRRRFFVFVGQLQFHHTENTGIHKKSGQLFYHSFNRSESLRPCQDHNSASTPT